MIKSTFDGFDIYTEDEANSFVYADFYDSDVLIDGLTDYIFSDENILNYTNSATKLMIDEEDPTCWTQLYKNISIFLNSEIEEYILGAEPDEVIDILRSESVLVDKGGTLIVQKDKIGKIGEYAFHVLLSNYFGLSCILPKVKNSTNRNMSVFGIDTLFLDSKTKTIFFGESKFSMDIDAGITLANRSLERYEHQIKEEYKIVLSRTDAFPLSSSFVSLFGKETQLCISFDKFIAMAGIKSIGVPVFIAHGKKDITDTPMQYVDKLKKKIVMKTFFGLSTKYILISLPVIDKSEFVRIAMEKVAKKQSEYERKCP